MHRLMTLFSAALITTSTLAAQADDYYKCQLLPIPDYTDLMSLSGTVTIKKSEDKKFTLDINAQITMTEDDGTIETEEIVVTDDVLTDGHMSAEEVLKSDEWQELKTIFGDEAPRGAHYFQTPQYSDDGSGYFVSVIHGEKGSKKSFVYLGWMPAICL